MKVFKKITVFFIFLLCINTVSFCEDSIDATNDISSDVITNNDTTSDNVLDENTKNTAISEDSEIKDVSSDVAADEVPPVDNKDSISMILAGNKFYKEAVEMFTKAQNEMDRGDYDKSYEYSELAKELFRKAKDYNGAEILYKTALSRKQIADFYINKAKTNGAENYPITKDMLTDALKSFDEGDGNLKNGVTDEDTEKKVAYFTDAIQNFEDSANKAKDLMGTLAKLLEDERLKNQNTTVTTTTTTNSTTTTTIEIVDVEYTNTEDLLKQAEAKRLKLLNEIIISENDNDDVKIMDYLTKGYTALDNKEYDKCRENATNAISYMDGLIAKNDVLKNYKLAKDIYDDAVNKNAKVKFKAKMNDAKQSLDSSLVYLNKNNLTDSLKNSNYVIELIKGFDYSVTNTQSDGSVFPKFYKVRLITSKRDCLIRISAYPFIFNDPSKWMILYKANIDKLKYKNNPNLIFPNQIFEIPSINGEIREGVYDPEVKYEKFNNKKKYNGE